MYFHITRKTSTMKTTTSIDFSNRVEKESDRGVTCGLKTFLEMDLERGWRENLFLSFSPPLSFSPLNLPSPPGQSPVDGDFSGGES